MHTTQSPRRILRLRDVRAKTGLGHDSIYRWAREGRFPRPIKLGESASGWLEDEVDAWIASKVAARDVKGESATS